jgi:PKHD-type hydroxylase
VSITTGTSTAAATPCHGEGSRYRSDVAITIFLNDPQSYDGGELEVRTAFDRQAVKLVAGNALAYPASSLHRVSLAEN